MLIIQFCVLCPTAQISRVGEVFQTALDKLVESGKLGSGKVTIDDSPSVEDELERTLRQNYSDEHEGKELEDSQVVSYGLVVDNVKGSVNQLAMVLSRLLTPQATLPKDHVLLEDERTFEKPAIYPWTVEIKRG